VFSPSERGAGGWWVAAGAFGYLVVLLSFRLDRFPGLHGDEAWTGLFALRLASLGLYTPRAMNSYSGPLFAWLVSRMFHVVQPGVASLRLLGVAANACAVLILLVHFGRRFGMSRAFGWLLAIATTPMFLMKWRVAWEVYALQNLMIALLTVLLWQFLDNHRYSFPRVLAFVALTVLGVQSHVIFASVPLSLVVFASAELVVAKNWRVVPLWGLSVSSVLTSGALLGMAARVPQEAWLAHRVAYLVGAAVTVMASALLVRAAWLDTVIRRVFVRMAADAGWRAVAIGLLAVGALAFVALHLVALLQVIAGAVIFERIVSWMPSFWLFAPMIAWLLVVVGATAGRAIAVMTNQLQLSDYERLIALWPFAYMTIFVMFRPIPSIRHFEILMFLLTLSLASALPAVVARHRSVLALAAALIVPLHIRIWREMIDPVDRPPFRFRIGWSTETSSHFVSLDAVTQALERDGVCRVDSSDVFLRQPLQFYLATHPINCRSSKVLEAAYCTECADPPYVRWRLR
jgi:hypothetical protein